MIHEAVFTELPSHLPDDALLVFNNTKVIHARLKFRNAKGAEIEVFCLESVSKEEPLGCASWNCLVGRLKKWGEDEELRLERDGLILRARLQKKTRDSVVVQFSWSDTAYGFEDILDRMGTLPIPPYLNRETEAVDEERYQTNYAKRSGSVAAPTAGLHFTPSVMEALKNRGIQTLEVTLHVGTGTFKPVKSDTMQGHDMHSEWIDVGLEQLEALIGHAGPVIAVGTTSLRTLETLYWMGVKATQQPEARLDELEIRQWDAYEMRLPELSTQEALLSLRDWMKRNGETRLVCKTQILIAPPYRLKVVKGIVTNFHQPQSTLLLLVAVVVGQEWKRIYDHALMHGFRFLSYGDSSLLMTE